MKLLLFSLLIIAAINVKAQEKPKAISMELKGDTLIVPYYPPQYKYIKIGERVYQIEAPILKEVPKPFWFPNSGIILNDSGYLSLPRGTLAPMSTLLHSGQL